MTLEQIAEAQMARKWKRKEEWELPLPLWVRQTQP